MSLRNRLGNADNRFQGGQPRVLCVCSAGLLRPPAAAFLLSQPPYNFNTRACGHSADFALVVLDDVLIHWADAFVVMNNEQEDCVKRSIYWKANKPVYNLLCPDEYNRMAPELVAFMSGEFKKIFPDGNFVSN